jgi:hypothetical protein
VLFYTAPTALKVPFDIINALKSPVSVLVQFLGKNSVQGSASLLMAVPESANSSITIVLFYTAPTALKVPFDIINALK